MTDRLVSMPRGSNYTAVRNPQDPNQFIVSDAMTGQSYVVDPTSPEYASVNQDIRMAINLAMTSEISQAQSSATAPATEVTKPAAGSSTPAPAQSGDTQQVPQNPWKSPQHLQKAMSDYGKSAWDWGFASWSPSGWGTGGWNPNPGPSAMWFAQQAGYGPADQQRIASGLPPLGGNADAFQNTYNQYYGIKPPAPPQAPQTPQYNSILGDDFWKSRGISPEQYHGIFG